MAHKQVLLVKPVKGLGNEGEAVKVKAGFARNYLFPQGKALPVNRGTKRQLEVLAKRRDERLARELTEAKDLAGRMGSMVMNVTVKTGEDGKPHGAVTTMELQKALKAQGIEVDRHQIKVGEAIKTLGEHTVTVKIHPEVTAELKVNVTSETPIVDKKEAAPRKPRKNAE